MNRPLLISDCDEVLLHMVTHFRDWLAETQAVDFAFVEEDWGRALVHRDSGEVIARDDIWPYLDRFFDTEMPRQTLVPGALDALARIGESADIVILTNLPDHRRQPRIDQLARHGIRHRVFCNQGGKGEALAAILAETTPSVAVFVDDLAMQHKSVAAAVPEVWRLHMIAEPELAPHRTTSPYAHARIDDWRDAADWVLARFAEGPAPALTAAEREA